MSDPKSKYIAALEATVQCQSKEIMGLQQEIIRLDKNTFQPHRKSSICAWDDGNDTGLAPEEDDGTEEPSVSSLATFRADQERLARHAQRTTEAKIEAERKKLKMEKEKRASEQAKGKSIKDKIVNKLLTLRGKVDAREAELNEVTEELNNANCELNSVRLEYTTIKSNIENAMLNSNNVYDNSVVTNHIYYAQGHPTAATVPVESPASLQSPQIPLNIQADTTQQEHPREPALALRPRSLRRHPPHYQDNCRFRLSCTNPGCRFVHEDQRVAFKDLINQLPSFTG
ncbi:hypothetical protein EJ07DRAFT_152428 [Lizonia empirigonia]|nr:hypothetical protein EJ07DRAFT_152428 [Lizonia empirigonia]